MTERSKMLKTVESHHQVNPDGSITAIGLREDGTYFQSTSKLVGRFETPVDLVVQGDLKGAFESLKEGGRVGVSPKPTLTEFLQHQPRIG